MESGRRRCRIVNYKLAYSTKPTKVFLTAVKTCVEKEKSLSKEEISLLKFEQNLKQQLNHFKKNVQAN